MRAVIFIALVCITLFGAACYRTDSTTCSTAGVTWYCPGGEKCAPLELGACLIETCGNGKLDPGEDCDGSAPVGKSCLDYGYNGGRIRGCTSTCTADLSGCGIGWAASPTSRLLARDAEGSLYSLWGSAPDHVVAGSSLYGPITFDGAQWSVALADLAEAAGCRGLWGSADDDVYCARDFPYHFDGSSWSQITEAPATNAVWGSASNDVFMVGPFGNIGHFDGTSWTNSTPDANGTEWNGVFGDGPRNVFAVGNGGALQRWDGFAWNPESSGTTADLQSLWGANGVFFVVGGGGTILRGHTGAWTTMSAPTTHTLYAVWGRSLDEIYAAGEGGVLLRFDGSGWTAMDSGTENTLRALWGTSSDVFAAGANGALLHLGGDWFAPVTTTGVDDLEGAWGDSDEDVFAVGANGAIRRFDGTSWTEMQSQSLSHFHTVWGSGPDDVWAGGDEDLRHYDGTSWAASTLNLSFGDSINTLWGTGPDDLWAAATSSYTMGALYHFDGSTWSSVVYDLPAALRTVWSSGPNDVYIGGGALDTKFNVKGFFQHFDGSAWLPVDLGAHAIIFGLWGSSSSDLFALAENLQESDVWHFDGGRWSRMFATPATHLSGAPGDLFAVGADRIDHFDGTSWSSFHPPVFATWSGVSVQPSSVFFVGTGGTVLRLMRAQPSLP
jgi:hypothetical protein